MRVLTPDARIAAVEILREAEPGAERDAQIARVAADFGEPESSTRAEVEERASNGSPAEIESLPLVRTLAQVLADPELSAPPRPVVPRLVYAGRVSLLAAREKLGKSTLASAAVAAVSVGRPFLDEPVERGRALVVGLDEHQGDSARRLVRFVADPEGVLLLDRLDGRKPLDTLARVVAEHAPAVVVVDALANIGALAGVQDASSSAAWTPVLARIARFARDTGAGVLLLHHARKSDGMYRDSSAIGASVDAIFEMSEGSGLGVREIRGRARWPVDVFSLRLLGELRDDDAPLAFELTAGELSLDARVLLFVEARPGCSVRDVRAGVIGGNAAIDRVIAGLLERGPIEDRGDGQGRALHAAARRGGGAVPGAVPDTTAPGENPHGHATGAVSARSGGTGCAESPNPRGAVGGTVREEVL
ncbi:hypothetical protein BH18GEM1_BH18GEM1_22470 [soil metagenome]